MSKKYGDLNVSEILRFTMFFSVSLRLVTHIHFLCSFVAVVQRDVKFSRKLKRNIQNVP